MADSTNATDVLEKLVKTIVDYPEKVQVKRIEGTSTLIYEVRVSPEDIGKVIGKQGKTAEAIRTIVQAISRKSGKNTIVSILS
ncbi:MAG TPA: KH domain-containing protein [Caldisericia bacterium]|nr:KH domain-containing protein [Caldisericia bacterium]HOL82456.1 KH domain-containing protein [Caldisericia bacterium]HPC56669.1 KH domain-containing protein [Caldisericia bacterium]HPP43409.1 KH domain-containing protein [Caldisericia bacterium]HRT36820.1 KH domain-containing protein [Caldisericia bacterium]